VSRRARWGWALAWVVAAALPLACDSARGAAAPATGVAPRRYGEVMSEVGLRFERAGKAALAGRWAFAAYDVGELEETFEHDVPVAIQPPEVKVDLAPIARTMPHGSLASLLAAVQMHDEAAFRAAYASTAATCDGCHRLSGHAFIQVATVPGEATPLLTPVAAAGEPDGGTALR
jgi:hypothetical protein